MSAIAAVLAAFQSPLQLQSFPLPESLEPGAILVQVQMAGVCGTDVHLWKGELPIELPVILGHETVGRIERLGPGQMLDWTGQPLAVNDRVTWNSSFSCGKCRYCVEKKVPTRCPSRRAYGIGYRCDRAPHWLGGYAQYHYLRPGTTLFKLPSALPTEAVIGAGCALITAIHGVERLCNAGAADDPSTRLPVLPELWRDTVVVQGSGPVGIAATAVARRAGARRIMVVGHPKPRLELARRFGADATLDIQEMPDPKARIAAVRDWSGGDGADAVLECVGSPPAVPEGMEMCRDGGRVLVLGHYCDAGPVSWNPHVVTRKQLQVFGAWSSEPRHLKASLDFLSSSLSEFPFEAMVTHRFRLDQANEALAATAAWQSAKSVLMLDAPIPAERD